MQIDRCTQVCVRSYVLLTTRLTCNWHWIITGTLIHLGTSAIDSLTRIDVCARAILILFYALTPLRSCTLKRPLRWHFIFPLLASTFLITSPNSFLPPYVLMFLRSYILTFSEFFLTVLRSYVLMFLRSPNSFLHSYVLIYLRSYILTFLCCYVLRILSYLLTFLCPYVLIFVRSYVVMFSEFFLTFLCT